MNNISRNNHFVAQMYLNAWKDNNNKIHEYRLLVPHEKYNLWNLRGTEYTASEENFYICLNGDNESDEIEKWLNSEFETPAKIALEKAIKGDKLNADDWNIIIKYIACQIVRTPAFLKKFLVISKNTLPKVLDDTIKQIDGKLSNKLDKIDFTKLNSKKSIDIAVSFPLRVRNTGIVEDDNRLFRIETIMGKGSYLYYLKYMLTHTEKVLHKHRWQVVELENSVIIPTTDDPVICLNYYGFNNYDFGGGWNRKGSEIIFPISPNKIIYTRIGYKKRIIANYELSILIKKIIIDHAYRKIFSNFDDTEIVRQRKRYVDKSIFEKEKAVYKDFHNYYKNVEKGYLTSTSIIS